MRFKNVIHCCIKIICEIKVILGLKSQNNVTTVIIVETSIIRIPTDKHILSAQGKLHNRHLTF